MPRPFGQPVADKARKSDRTVKCVSASMREMHATYSGLPLADLAGAESAADRTVDALLSRRKRLNGQIVYLLNKYPFERCRESVEALQWRIRLIDERLNKLL